jgi:hypothetical protein
VSGQSLPFSTRLQDRARSASGLVSHSTLGGFNMGRQKPVSASLSVTPLCSA